MFRELLENRSLTIVDATDVLGDDGVDVLVVVAKLAFRFDERSNLRVTARPIRHHAHADEAGGVKWPRDYSLPFGGTDCFLIGTARPSRAACESKVLTMAVGPLKKSVRLFGPRVYMKTPAGVRPGPSANVVSTPLRFDHCFGGCEPGNYGSRVRENPIGRGHAIDPERLIGVEAHRLEPVGIGVHPSAGCFAPIDENWAPRIDHGGTFDPAWQRRHAPAAPPDRDRLYHSSARPEQRTPAPLTLPLDVSLAGFGGDDAITFTLPAYGIAVVTELHGPEERGGGSFAHDAPLTRVGIDVDERVVELSFVAHVPLPMKWERLRKVRVLAQGSLPEDVQPTPTTSVGDSA